MNMRKGELIHYFTFERFNESDMPTEYSLSRYRGEGNESEVSSR